MSSKLALTYCPTSLGVRRRGAGRHWPSGPGSGADGPICSTRLLPGALAARGDGAWGGICFLGQSQRRRLDEGLCWMSALSRHGSSSPRTAMGGGDAPAPLPWLHTQSPGSWTGHPVHQHPDRDVPWGQRPCYAACSGGSPPECCCGDMGDGAATRSLHSPMCQQHPGNVANLQDMSLWIRGSCATPAALLPPTLGRGTQHRPPAQSTQSVSAPIGRALETSLRANPGHHTEDPVQE